MSDVLSVMAPLIIAIVVFTILPSCSCCFKLKRRVINRFKSPYDFQGALTAREKETTSPHLFLFVDRFTRPWSHFVRAKAQPLNTSHLLAELQITVQSQNDISQISNLQETKRQPLSLRASNYAEEIPHTPLSIKTCTRTERSKGKENKKSKFFRKLRSFEGHKHCFSPLAQNNMHTHSRDNSFQEEEAKRAGPSLFAHHPPTPDALTPDSSMRDEESVEQEIDPSESDDKDPRMESQFNLKLINKSRNPKYVRVKELGQPRTLRSKSTFNNSSFLQNLQPPTLRKLESEHSLPQKLVKPNLRSSRQNSLPMRTLTTSLRTDESQVTDSPVDSYLFKPFLVDINEKLMKRKFQAQMAKRVRSSSPVTSFVSMNNEEFNKVLVQIKQKEQNNCGGGLLACVRDQASTAGTSPMQLISQYSKPVFTRRNTGSKQKESADYSHRSDQYGPKRDSHQFYGRSPDIYFSSGKLFTTAGPNSSQNLFKQESSAALLGEGSRQISNISSFGGHEAIERGRSRIRADELISFPSNEEAELAQDLLKQLSPRSNKHIRPFDCSYFQEPSIEQKQQDSKIHSPVSELYVHTQSAYASGPESHLKSIHESSEPDSRSYSRLSPKVMSPATKKTHRMSTFKSPKRGKVEESETKENSCSNIELNSSIMLYLPNSNRGSQNITPIDVTDCETLSYTIYSRSEILREMLDLSARNKKSYFTEMRSQTQEIEVAGSTTLAPLDLRLKYGRYARDFTAAAVKQHLGLFAALRNPELKHKYQIDAKEEENKEEVRLELQAFGADAGALDIYKNKQFRSMNQEEIFLHLQGMNPFQEYRYLRSHSQFSKDILPLTYEEQVANRKRLEATLHRQKDNISQLWRNSNIRTLAPLKAYFSTSLASFKVVFSLLLLKELIAVLLVGLSCHLLSHRWDESDTPEEIMLSWAILSLISLILGLFILQPLNLRFRYCMFKKYRGRKCVSFMLGLEQFKKYENDRKLVQNYKERRLMGREEHFALSNQVPQQQQANNEAIRREKISSLSIYRQLYFT